MKRCVYIIAAIMCFISTSCISTEKIPEMELTNRYRIIVGTVSNLNDLNSIATKESRIKVPILYEVVSDENVGQLLECIDFAKIWVKVDSVWYVLGKWNYIKIDTVAETCTVTGDKQECEPYAQDIFEMLESHPELFAVPQITDKPYEWNGTGYVTLKQIETTNSTEA